jgi:dihydrofolate reductase
VLASWRESHGREGGERNADDEVVKESLAAAGAVVMGRRMFSGGEGPWEDDPVADGWWGDEPPFGVPVFVLTHRARETVTKRGGTSFTFVTDGIEAALERARETAGERDVHVAGGDVVQQCLRAGPRAHARDRLTCGHAPPVPRRPLTRSARRVSSRACGALVPSR